MKAIFFILLYFIISLDLFAEARLPNAFVYPLNEVRISSSFGSRKHPIHKVKKHHSGIDLAAKKGTSVHSTLAGSVIFAGKHGSYGNLVVIQHKEGISTHYAHLNTIDVALGQTIWTGQIIGAVGSTGGSTGFHLHFEVRADGIPLDPLSVIESLDAVAKG